MGNYFDVRSFDSEDKTAISTIAPKILVVDDSILVRKQISKLLISEGYDVMDHSSNGLEAVDMYKKLFPDVDLVTMDISIPRMGGLKALELILEFDKNAKVVMISALGKEDISEKAVQAGALGYIMKPLNRDHVSKTLSAVFNNV